MAGQSIESFVMPISKKIASRVNPALLAADIGVKKSKDLSIEMYGYDFPSLIGKLVVYFIFMFLINKFFEAVIFGSGFIKSLAGLMGFNLPNIYPEWFTNFMQNGYQGAKFWDVVKAGAILLITWEMYLYYRNNERLGGKVSPMTIGIFGAMLAMLVMITIPELWQRLKELSLLNSGGGGQSDGHGAGR